MTAHELKTWPEPFTAILEGRKTHEIRRADRPFAVGDILHLREHSPPRFDVQGWYTGREVLVRVTYLTSGGSWGLPDDLCVMSIDASQPLESAAFTQAVGDTLISVANETPFADEAKDALAQRGKLLAEIGTLKAERDALAAKLADAHEQLDACCERCLDKCPHAPTVSP